MAKTAQPTNLRLNLLYSQGSAPKLLTKLIKWLLSFGRYIGVIVEIVVLVTFAARFKLDSDLASINEKINSQIPYIENLNTQADEIRQTQFKISVVKKSYGAYLNWKGILDKMAAQTPPGVIFSTLNFDQTGLPSGSNFKLSGQAASNNDLAVLLNGFKSETAFKDINLVNLNFDDTGLVFTITGAVK